MKKRTGVFTRLGIGAVTVATFGMGIPLLSSAPAAAATGTEQLNIVPVSATNNTQDNACQWYRVTASNQQWDSTNELVYDGDNRYAGQRVNVILNPSAGINSQFCDATDASGTTSDQGNGIPDQYQFALQHSNDYNQEYFEFGVNEANTPNANGDVVAGTIGIQAYVDLNNNNQVGSGEPQTSATDNIVAGTPGLPTTTLATSAQQDNLVDKVTAVPATQDGASDKPGNDYTWFKVTAFHGNDTMQGVDINYQVTSKQGRVVNDTNLGPENNINNCESGPDFESNSTVFGGSYAGSFGSGGDGENQDPANDHGQGNPGSAFGVAAPYDGGQAYNADNETDGAGVVYCQVFFPQDKAAAGSNPAQTGPYDVDFFALQPCGGNSVGPVDNSVTNCHEPQDHTTLNTYTTPDNQTGVRPTCGDTSTARNSEKVCFELPKALQETFTARAVDIPSGGAPLANTVINWGLAYGGQCNQYTAGGQCNFFGNDAAAAGAKPAAKSSRRASPSFTQADSFTGVLGQITVYYEAQDGSIGVATMPDQCVTNSTGTCGVTMKLNKIPQDGATFFPIVAFNDIDAGFDGHSRLFGAETTDNGDEPLIGGNDCTTTPNDRIDNGRFACWAAAVEFSREFTPADTNITVHRSTSRMHTGKFANVTAQVMNQFFNHITYPDPVTFHCSHCTFSNGTKQLTEDSSADGRAQVAATRTHKGKAKITAVIGGASGNTQFAKAKPASPFSSGTLCGQHQGESRDGFGNIYYSPGARAGNCRASTTIHFFGPAKKQVEKPTLKAGRRHHHHVKLKAKTHPSLSSVKVKFFRKTGSGLLKAVGEAKTNSRGVAKARVHTHGHHLNKFKAKVVHLKKSLFISKFSKTAKG